MTHYLRTGLAALALTMVPGPLSAHDGHAVEATWSGVAHAFASPFHVALLFAAVVAVGACVALVGVALRRVGDAPESVDVPG